jgi:hypothetical protein
MGEMATLPASRDIIAVRHLDGPASGAISLVALRVTGPDGEGRYSVATTGQFAYPAIPDPAGAGTLVLTPWQLHADPTGQVGAERFVVGFHVKSDDNTRFLPAVVQEFAYDSTSGAIRPVSAPMLPGNRSHDGKRWYGYSAATYDNQGNLWAARHDELRGGPLAVHATPQRCPYDPATPMRAYVTSGTGIAPVWGRSCRPDYDILQARNLLAAQGIARDPVTHDLALVSFGGGVLPIRPTGTGRTMTFLVGNLVDLGRKLLPTVEGNLPDHRVSPIDADHRLWVTAMHARPGAVGADLDQWLYSVNIADLFDPRPVPVSAVAGRVTTLQAEHTVTSTTAQRRGGWAAVDVDSDAFLAGCADWPVNIGCGYDGTAGNGYVLVDDTGYGHLSGTVEYRIDVPVAGAYRFAYRAVTFAVTKKARIELTAGGRTYVTPVDTGGGWLTVAHSEPVPLPAGVQTIRLAPPDRGGGWALNWISLQRD